MKIWKFTITLSGNGETSEDAWENAIENFDAAGGLDVNCPPEDPELVEESEDIP